MYRIKFPDPEEFEIPSEDCSKIGALEVMQDMLREWISELSEDEIVEIDDV